MRVTDLVLHVCYIVIYDALMCIHVVLQDAPDFMTRNSVALSLFLMALRQAAITCALGFPTAEKRTKEMLTQNCMVEQW